MTRLELRPYQKEAAQWLTQTPRALVLASVGAGKTALTLTAIREHISLKKASKFLVLAPLRVCTDVWPTEARKWATSLKLAVACGSPQKRQTALCSSADIVVMNYEAIQSVDDLSSFDAVVFDELTRLKDPSGKRFKHLENLIGHINTRWGLTGSFTSNGLEDVFGQCRIADHDILGKAKTRFLKEHFFCINRDYGQWAPRPGSLEKVMARVKPYAYILEARDYQDSLPPLHIVPLKVKLTNRLPYDTMRKKMVLDHEGKEITAVTAAVLSGKLTQLASGFIYYDQLEEAQTRKRVTAESRGAGWFSHHKFDQLEDILNENQHANTVVVYNFQEELAELRRRYPTAKTIDAPNVVEDWNEGRVPLLLIHPRSAGHGLNLQYGGHHMVFLSLPWSLELYEQVIGRLHRGGQKTAVYIYALLTENTIDERIFNALSDKLSLAEAAILELKK